MVGFTNPSLLTLLAFAPPLSPMIRDGGWLSYKLPWQDPGRKHAWHRTSSKSWPGLNLRQTDLHHHPSRSLLHSEISSRQARLAPAPHLHHPRFPHPLTRFHQPLNHCLPPSPASPPPPPSSHFAAPLPLTLFLQGKGLPLLPHPGVPP